MKCPKCGGNGKEYWNGNVFCNTGFECDKCHGTGEVQTNEEWLRNLSFNEFARVLYCMIINGERIRPDLAYIKQWLKEIHKE